MLCYFVLIFKTERSFCFLIMIHAIQGLWKESFLTPKLYSSQKMSCSRAFSGSFCRRIRWIWRKCANCRALFWYWKRVWRQEPQFECTNRVTRPKADCEVVSEESEGDDEESRKKSVPNTVQTLTMLNNICQCPELDNQTIETLDGIIQRSQTLQLQRKKQQSLNKYFKVWNI